MIFFFFFLLLVLVLRKMWCLIFVSLLIRSFLLPPFCIEEIWIKFSIKFKMCVCLIIKSLTQRSIVINICCNIYCCRPLIVSQLLSTDHTQIKRDRYNTCFAYVINLFCWVYPTISEVDTQEVYTYAILSDVILWILWHVLDTKLSYLVV